MHTYLYIRVRLGVHEREKYSQTSIHFAAQILRMPFQHLWHKLIFIGLTDSSSGRNLTELPTLRNIVW